MESVIGLLISLAIVAPVFVGEIIGKIRFGIRKGYTEAAWREHQREQREAAKRAKP